jgi:hypothetical protein
MCDRLVKIEEQTFARLGDEIGGRFIFIASDAWRISEAIFETYGLEEVQGMQNLVFVAFQGMLKEVNWFHLFFMAGNYPLLNSRLRFVWESIFRAFTVSRAHSSSNASRTSSPAWPTSLCIKAIDGWTYL